MHPDLASVNTDECYITSGRLLQIYQERFAEYRERSCAAYC